MDADLGQPERPRYAAALTEDLLIGDRRLRHAFLQTPMRFAGRNMPLIRPGDPEPSVILMRSGFAFRSCPLRGRPSRHPEHRYADAASPD